MDDLIAVFRALSDRTRLRILKLLEGRELCVCEIFNALGMSQPKVSFHLNILKEAGVVKDRKQGKWTHYRLNDSDMFRRFLLLSALERIPDNEIITDRNKLAVFVKTKAAVTGQNERICKTVAGGNA